jgi:hypothetical protein
MTAIREMIRHLLRREEPAEEIPQDYIFTVHWLTEARSWDQAKRVEVLDALNDLMEDPAFTTESSNLKYQLDQIDDVQYTGASLAALRRVLEALNTQRLQEEQNHGGGS